MKADLLIEGLASDLRPVRRLAGTAKRTICWLSPLLLVSATLLWGLARPDTFQTLGLEFERWELAFAAATCITAAFAAFSASQPDRPLWMSYLPLPFLAAWLVLLTAATSLEMAGHTVSFLDFIPARSCALLLSSYALLPMIMLTVMLRRAAPLFAQRSAMLAGLASASFAVVMLRLSLFHAPKLMPKIMMEHIGSLFVLVVVTGAFYKALFPRRSSCPGEF